MHATTTESGARPGASSSRVCLICGGSRFTPQFPGGNGKPPRPAAAPYRITHSERRLVHAIVRCSDCGMVMLPQGAVPPSDYGDAEDPYYVEQAEERIANAHLLLDLVPSGGRLLEIGCACGFLLLAARERGFATRGVEMSVWASEYARREHGLDVHTGSLESLDAADESFDVVVLADVIEHLRDPRAVVGEIRRLLSPGGRLLLLTPDVGSLAAKLAGRRWWGLLDDHYFYFSRSTLRRLLEEEGFRVEVLRALGRRFPVGHWVFKLSQYSDPLYRSVSRATRALGIDGWRISINLGDQMACVARKK